MLQINRKVGYALTSLKYIQRKEPEELTSAKEISHMFNLPFDPTSRVLQLMAKNDILEAVQGVKGGYRFKNGIENISVRALAEMLIGSIELTKCMRKKKTTDCDASLKCEIIPAMYEMNTRINELFDNLYIQDLINK